VRESSNRPQAFATDANGNQLEADGIDAIAWTSWNTMASVTIGGVTERMLYDAYGNRRLKAADDGSRTVYLDGYELETSAGGATCERVRIDMPGDTAVFRLTWIEGEPPAGAATTWLQLTDLVESSVLEVGQDGAVAHFEEYLPYGQTAVAHSPAGLPGMSLKRRRHGSRERDVSSGLYYYGMRYYAPWLGRWMSPDPALAIDGLNLYAFAGGNPVTLSDTFGLAKTKNTKKKTNAKGGKKTTKQGGVQKVSHINEGIRSSKFRGFRRLQSALGGTRNLGMLKFVNKGKGGREVLYVVARSLGMGKSKLTLRYEEKEVGSGSKKTKKKRSHSEAVLRAVLEVGYVTVGGKRYDLSQYKVEYGASTNEACGAEFENCHEENVKHLSGTFYYQNAYTGGKSAGGFEKANNAFQRDVKKGDDESDTESEDEAEWGIVDTETLEGVNIGDGTLKTISATSFSDVFKSGPKKRKNVYLQPGRSMPRSPKKPKVWTKN
jgi:RHS repeat-associated protein